MLFENAQTYYNLSKLSGFGGIPENWYNVTVKPSNWRELFDDDSNLIEREIDLISGDTNSRDYLVLNENSALSLKIYSVIKSILW